jgi:peptidoglycan/xylan/chitin deacetylase (PgdA/CDA1 family)
VRALGLATSLLFVCVALATAQARKPAHTKVAIVARPAAPAAEAPLVAPKPKAPETSPEILLTFDDGPAIDKTPIVLDTLDKHNIKAVFFVLGTHLQGNSAAAAKSRELIREELRRGHAVGNHTIHHYFLCGHFYIKQAWQEIEGNAKLIEDALGQRPDLFRTPYGAHCAQLKTVLDGLGIKPIGWDIDPQDWRVKNAPKIEAYVEKHLQTLHGRAIVLFHDIQGATVIALPHILDWIDQENARRTTAGRPPIKIINYAYLLPQRHLVPPLLDVLGRVLVGLVNKPAESPIPLWPGGGAPLAWPAGQV